MGVGEPRLGRTGASQATASSKPPVDRHPVDRADDRTRARPSERTGSRRR
jgi:hypothetical protein